MTLKNLINAFTTDTRGDISIIAPPYNKPPIAYDPEKKLSSQIENSEVAKIRYRNEMLEIFLK